MVIGVDGATAAIRRFIDGWNDRCEPFTCTKPADEILAKAIGNETSLTRPGTGWWHLPSTGPGWRTSRSHARV